MNVEDRYDGFFSNETSAELFRDRYSLNGEETPTDTIHRVADFLGTYDEERERFFDVMYSGKAYPAGRTMANSGVGEHLTLNNCFVPYQVPNDMGEIYECVKIGALTHKAGGGTGYDFSLLSPNGTVTHNNAIASGPVSFMKSFDAQTDTVKTGNRRGANMGVLNVYHPDIYEFVTAKANDPNILKYFNISVMVDDAFMEAVEADQKIYLHYPVYNDKGQIEKDKSKWEQSREISAKALWEEIMQQAYDTGEPGVLQYDTMNEDNNLWYVENMVATNPCFTGDMELCIEEDGKIRSVPFKELNGRKDITVIAPYADHHKSYNNKVWCSGEKEVIEVYCEGATKPIKCTPNHIFRLWGDDGCEAKDLIGKKICAFNIETMRDRGSVLIYPSLVTEIRYCGIEKVYDFTENETHWGVVNGAIVHNCGEYLAGTLYGNNIDPKQYGGACNLGSIILHKFVKDPFTTHASFDEHEFTKTVRTMVRMLDNTIDVNTFPVDIYENYQKAFRTIGLGITSLADTIAMLGMKYNSKEALEWVDYLMEHFAYIAYSESVELAKEKDAFPMFDADNFICSGYLLKHTFRGTKESQDKWRQLRDDIKQYGIRNARLISIAPTGTLSLVWGNNCSSGIEPIFCLEYDRVAKIGGQEEENKHIIHVEDYAYSVAKKLGADTTHMTSALKMTVDEHIDMLSVIAYHTDMSVSKTINVPTDYPFEDAKNIYMRCWKEGIKGCTIFRPNKIRQGILGVSNDNKSTNTTRTTFSRGDIIMVNDDLLGYKRKVINGCGDFQLQIFFDDVMGEPLESYICMGDGGGCSKNLEAISRLISLCFRAGVDVGEVVKQLKKVSPCIAYCNRAKTKGDTSKGTSCPSAIGNAIEELNNKIRDRCFADEEELDDEWDKWEVVDDSKPITNPTNPNMICPECGSMLSMEGGCPVCKGDDTHSGCGWSHCG